MTDQVTFRPIGVIRTPYTRTEGMPIQATAAVGVRGRIEIDPGLVEGPADLEGFSHLILLYHLHLDIKPYVPAFDDRSDVRVGWFASRLGGLAVARADDRFRRHRTGPR